MPKLFNINAFADVVAAYGLVPDFLVIPVAVLLPGVEIVTAFGLLFKKNWARIAALLLLILFISILSYGIYLGLDIDCGCFGPEDPEHAAFSGLRTALVRDLFFLIPACYLLFIDNSWIKHIIKRRKV